MYAVVPERPRFACQEVQFEKGGCASSGVVGRARCAAVHAAITSYQCFFAHVRI